MKNLHALLAAAISLMCAACAVTPPPVAQETSARARASFASAPLDGPGLGTKWGETRGSLVGMTSFERANFNHPFAAAAIYYNDEAGIRAMAGTVAWEGRLPVLPRPSRSVGDD